MGPYGWATRDVPAAAAPVQRTVERPSPTRTEPSAGYRTGHRRYATLTPLEFVAIVFGISVAAGLLGSLLGLGGGIIIVPALTLLLGLDIKYAIGASILAVIATGSASAASYVRHRIANMRVGMLMETATVIGAISRQYLFIIFAAVMAATTLAMLRSQKDIPLHDVPADKLSDRLRLHTSYYDHAIGQTVEYRVTRAPLGLAVSGLAGLLGGLLGIGGGVLQVPLMSLGMAMPLKASTATSSFIMGVTAAAGAGVYLAHGMIQPFVAGPVVAGIFIGARIGTQLLPRLHARWIRWLLVAVMALTAIKMFDQGIRGDNHPRTVKTTQPAP